MGEVSIILRVPIALKREVQRIAKENERSLSQEVRLTLTRKYAPATQPAAASNAT